ncbi:hypothetical protein EI427_10635 [Flammeovirga pectinis]|uniref:DNA (cytosine-5-)-methyltransferase n=1 Tax=Flammeovirga pectinis TaxID=2494373 RepID=A0A3S9P394_9BACT|nr:hypothetical protein [Flammeovirga pectinis]AZQ62675.1 hypothetical protein EI427_10635 [Flammeovirga pectinis]
MLNKNPFDLSLEECYRILKFKFATNNEEVKFRSLTMVQAEKLLGLRNNKDHSIPKFYGNALLEKIEESMTVEQ